MWSESQHTKSLLFILHYNDISNHLSRVSLKSANWEIPMEMENQYFTYFSSKVRYFNLCKWLLSIYIEISFNKDLSIM